MSLNRRLACFLVLALAVPCALAAQAVRGPEIVVSASAEDVNWLPTVGVTANGDFVVAFQRGFFLSGQETSHVWVRLFRADGTPKGHAFRVSNAPAAEGFPSLAVAPDGEFAVVWQSGSSLATSIWGRLFTADGTPLGERFRLSEATHGSQRQPDVALLPGGGFVAVWDEAGGPFNQGEAIFARRFDALGAPLGPDVEVGESFPEKSFSEDLDEIQARVAVAPDGGFLVTWMSYGGERSFFDIDARAFSPDGAPLGEVFRVNHGPLVRTSQFDATLATLLSGEAVVAWASNGAEVRKGEDPAVDGVGLFARRLGAEGVPVGPSFKVNTFTPGRQERPAIAALPDGGFFVVWSSETSPAGASTVFIRRFAADAGRRAPSGKEVSIALSASAGKGYPAIAVNPDHQGVVAWVSFDALGGSAVIARRIVPRR
jgi:hypothetical protein